MTLDLGLLIMLAGFLYAAKVIAKVIREEIDERTAESEISTMINECR